VFDSINRMEGTSIDWSQLSSNNKSSHYADNTTASSNLNFSQLEKNSVKDFSEDSKEKLYKELEKANSTFQALNHSLRMKFNEDAEQFYVEVIDSRTHEVLDSIPADYVLELAAKLKDMVGFFIDEKR